MKTKITFTIDCGPNTFWRCRVNVWPTHQAMIRYRGEPGDCLAFCTQFSPREAYTTDVAAEMNFESGKCPPGIVAHEAVHAALAYAELAKLNLKSDQGEETFAESVEHLTAGTLWHFRNERRHRRKITVVSSNPKGVKSPV